MTGNNTLHTDKELSIADRIDQRLTAYRENEVLSPADIEAQENEMNRLMDADARLNKMLAALKMPSRWGYSAAGALSKDLVSKHLNSQKTGLHSMYPILCNGSGCPYSTTCFAFKYNIQPPVGEPCVIETTKMEELTLAYDKDFHFDECSATDMLAIHELIHLDIMIDRCNALIAQELTPVIDVNIGVIQQTGDVITQPAISKYYEAYEKMSKRRSAIVDELNASRKAKRKDTPDTSKQRIDILRSKISDASFFDIEQKPDNIQ